MTLPLMLRRVSRVPLLSLALMAGLGAAPALACPDWRLNGHQLDSHAANLAGGHRLSLTAGGNQNLSNCPMPGVGYVTSAPDVTMTLRNTSGQDLSFRVVGECDTVLLVNDARADWHFNDDSVDLDPALTLPAAPDGVYDIWVGTYGPATCRAELQIRTVSAAPPPECPDPSLTGSLMTYSARDLARGMERSTTAGGAAQLSDCAAPGTGYVDARPQFTLDLTSAAPGSSLDLRVQAPCDTVMLVSDPFGNWSFNDDSDGLNPRITLEQATAGRYGIWLGTYGPTACDARLTVTATGVPDIPRPDDGKPPLDPRPDALLPDPGNLMAFRNRVGETIGFVVTGSDSGAIWGTDVYSDDSSLARAAVHAGILQVGESGEVRVTILPGQASYAASTRNGITSSSWGAWSGSFRIVRGDDTAAAGLVRPVVPGQRGARLLGVVTRSAADYVSAGEQIAPNGRADAQFRIAVQAPGDTISAIEIRNTSGTYSVWDTISGNGYWTLAAVSDGRLLSRADTSVSIPLGAGEMVLDLFVEASGDQVADGRTGYTISLTMQSGQHLQVAVPADRRSGLTPSHPQPFAGLIRVISATYGGNCRAPQGNVTAHIAAQCNGQSSCTYVVDYTVIGDPAYGCAKDYVVTYDCGDGQIRTAMNPPEPPYRQPVTLECTGQPGPQGPAAAGEWSINANNFAGRLVLNWTGGGWTGHVHYDAHRRDEPLENITFDPASGRIEFTRPIPGATQIYRGVILGSRIEGQFNQGGGNYIYNWTATR